MVGPGVGGLVVGAEEGAAFVMIASNCRPINTAKDLSKLIGKDLFGSIMVLV